MKFKSYFIMFIASILLFANSLSATAITDNNYKQTIDTYIGQLSQLQNQLFSLANKTTFPTPETKATFNSDIGLITSNLNSIQNAMTDYYKTLPKNSEPRRDMLILFNATTLLQSALFELNRLNTTSSDAEKMIILENYFRFRLGATETLNLVREVLA